MPRNPSPAATQPSTEPSPARSSGAIRALKALILIAALIWVGKKVVDAIRAVHSGDLALQIRPAWLGLSALVILATYCLLIWSWLYIVRGLSGKSIPLLSGARIWFISNLGTLLPGRIWGIIQMGAMSAEQGINPVAAGAASIINAAVNIATGMAVGVIAGLPAIVLRNRFGAEWTWIAWALTGAAILGVVLLPIIVPWAFRVAHDRFGANVPTEDVPPRIIAVSVAANVVSWFLYGAAFLCLRRGVLDVTASSLIQHTAAFATSYVVGYMFIIVPGGMGVREETLTQAMVAAGMATPVQANAISVVSRLWLLIIQVLPALIFLAYRRPRADEKDR